MKSRALIVAACLLAFGIVSCGKKTEEPKPDSTAVTVDTTGMKPADTMAHPMDTVKAPTAADTAVLKPNDSLTKKDSMPVKSSKATSTKTKTETKTSTTTTTTPTTPATPTTHESTSRRGGTGGGTTIESKPRR